jgi:hypothetical protein
MVRGDGCEYRCRAAKRLHRAGLPQDASGRNEGIVHDGGERKRAWPPIPAGKENQGLSLPAGDGGRAAARTRASARRSTSPPWPAAARGVRRVKQRPGTAGDGRSVARLPHTFRLARCTGRGEAMSHPACWPNDPPAAQHAPAGGRNRSPGQASTIASAQQQSPRRSAEHRSARPLWRRPSRASRTANQERRKT